MAMSKNFIENNFGELYIRDASKRFFLLRPKKTESGIQPNQIKFIQNFRPWTTAQLFIFPLLIELIRVVYFKISPNVTHFKKNNTCQMNLKFRHVVLCV